MADETPEECVISEFRAMHEAHTAAMRSTCLALSMSQDIQARTRRLIRAGQQISGVPERGAVFANARLTRHKRWGWIIEASFEGVSRPLRFPARWLGMEVPEWQAELRAMIDLRDQRKQNVEARRRQEIEDAERAELARLQAKYIGEPE